MNSPRLCPECGASLPEGDSGRRCPSCLLRLALGEGAEPPTRNVEIDARPDPESTTDFLNLRRIGDYEIIGEIARGGMGVVYKARQRSLKRVVALKRILSQKLATPEMLLRFQVETEAIAKLDHPNIVPLYEIGEHDGIQFFTMKLVEGGNLADRLAKCSPDRKLETRSLISLLIKVCRSVHHAHQRGILHRDLKPSNILIDERGEPHVSDFGLAKILERDSEITRNVSIVGSPNYMAPEQAGANGQSVTTAADIYSLGAILYEMLTGEPPFQAGTPLETMRRVVEEAPRRPRSLNRTVDRDLETICLRTLEKVPSRRYGSADELGDDLERWLNGEPVYARPITVLERAVRWARRNPALALTSALAFACLVALAIGSTLSATRIAAAKRESDRLLAQAQTREAERLFAEDRSAEGLALLAQVARRFPEETSAASRLASALAHRRFATPAYPQMRHDSHILDAVILRDAGLIQTVTEGGIIHRWNLANGKPVDPEFQIGTRLLDAQFSETGERMGAVTKDHGVQIWRISDVVERANTIDDSRLNNAGKITIAPAGDLVGVAAKHADTVHLFNADNGGFLRSLSQPSAITGRSRFSRDGRRMALGLSDGRVMVWDVDSGEPLPHEFRHDRFVMDTAFSPDGRLLASASNDQTARVWDLQTGKGLPFVARHRNETTSVSFSEDGRRLITGSWDFSARVWDLNSGRLAGDPLSHPAGVSGIAAMALPDLVCTLSFAEAWAWRVREAHLTPLVVELSLGGIPIAFNPAGDRIATGEANGRLRIWNPKTRDPTQPAIEHRAAVGSVAFSPDGKSVAVAIYENAAWIRRLDTGESVRLPHEGWVRSVRYDSSGLRLVTASHDHTARIWDTDTGQSISLALGHNDEVHYAEFSPDGRRIVTASRDSTAGIWDSKTGERLKTLRHVGLVALGRFSPNGQVVATGSSDHRGRLWSLSRDGRLVDVNQPVELPHHGSVVWLDFSPDGRWVATASFDHTARLWSVETGEPRPYVLRHDDPVEHVSFSPDGRRVATSSRDSTARVWSVETGHPLTEPLRHSKSVVRAIFSPDGNSVATSSLDGTVKIWPLPRVVAGDSDWLCDLAEFVARRRPDATGFSVPLDAGVIEFLRTQLQGQSARSPLIRWFLDPAATEH